MRLVVPFRPFGYHPLEGGRVVLERSKAALVVIDIQEKLFAVMADRDRLRERVLQAIRGCRIMGLPVVWSEQYPDGMGPTIQPVAALLTAHEPMPKKSFSVVGDDALKKHIQGLGRKQFILTGIEAHVCVYQTAVDLLDLGYEVEVVSDAVSSRNEENRRIGLERARRAGAAITSVETVLFELLRVAEGPRFKQVLAILK